MKPSAEGILGAAVLMAVAGAGPARAQPGVEPQLPSVELPPAVARVLTDYETAWRATDARGLAYATDGSVG